MGIQTSEGERERRKGREFDWKGEWPALEPEVDRQTTRIHRPMGDLLLRHGCRIHLSLRAPGVSGAQQKDSCQKER